MDVLDAVKKHWIYGLFSIVAASSGVGWYSAHELLVKPKDAIIEEKNACIETLRSQLEALPTKPKPQEAEVQHTKPRPGLQNKSARYVEDLLLSMATSRSGLKVELCTKSEYQQWMTNMLGMLRDVFADRQSDVYVAWLKPIGNAVEKLGVFAERGLPTGYQHYQFQLNEGLAGKVWATGIPASTSMMKQHPWWVYREGCTNVSYICVPVGEKAGRGGILTVGSDKGFEIHEGDEELVRVFAAFLTVAISAEKN